MGNQGQHHEKAKRIAAFAQSIQGSGHSDWVAIALFYRALHDVEEMLAAKGEHTRTHNERHVTLKSRFPEILREYRPLYNYSLVCRYRFQDGPNEAELQELERRIAQLEEYVRLEIDEG